MPYSGLVQLLRTDDATLQVIRDYVYKHPGSVTEKDQETGRIALHDAVEEFELPPFADGDGDTGMSWISDVDVVDFLARVNRFGASERDNQDELPLHIAAHTGDLDFCRILVQHFPDGTLIPDNKGYLPIHRALLTGIGETAEFLLEHHVGHIGDIGVNQGLPPLLHFALRLRVATMAFIRSLLERAPYCVSTADTEFGEVALQVAIRNSAPLDQVELILNANPRAILRKNESGCLPLHLEALNGARPDVLALLLHGYPNGVRVPTANGRLPIHCALQNDTITDESLNHLNSYYPQGLRVKDKDGYPPLHHAVLEFDAADRGAVSEAAVSWAIRKDPEMVSVPDTTAGGYVLHHAARNSKFPVCTLQLLIETFPAALQTRDNAGYLPLEAALSRGPEIPKENIQLLHGKYPHATRVAGNRGQLPLHLACRSGASFDIVSMLVKSYPRGREHYDESGRLPIHIAISFGADPSFVNLLVVTPEYSSSEEKAENVTATPKNKCIHPLFYACQKDVSLDATFLLARNSLVTLLPGSTSSTGKGDTPTALSIEPFFSVYVRNLTGKVTKLECASFETVADLKHAFLQKEGIPVRAQRLIYCGKQLCDEKTLASIGIKANATFHMVPRLIGGARTKQTARMSTGETARMSIPGIVSSRKRKAECLFEEHDLQCKHDKSSKN